MVPLQLQIQYPEGLWSTAWNQHNCYHTPHGHYSRMFFEENHSNTTFVRVQQLSCLSLLYLYCSLRCLHYHMIVEADSAARWPHVMVFAPYNNKSSSTFLSLHVSFFSLSQPNLCYISSEHAASRPKYVSMGKDHKAKTPSHSRVGSLSNLPYSAVAAAAEVDRKVYIPLCFCLVSFAVMVYIN